MCFGGQKGLFIGTATGADFHPVHLTLNMSLEQRRDSSFLAGESVFPLQTRGDFESGHGHGSMREYSLVVNHTPVLPLTQKENMQRPLKTERQSLPSGGLLKWDTGQEPAG